MKKIRLAGCIIQRTKGELLLIHRNVPGRVQWELPGGKVEENELPEETAKREISEELGITVSNLKKLGEQSFTEDGYEMDYVWYLAQMVSGEPSLKESKFDEMKYFTWEEAKNEPKLSENTKNLVKAYFQNFKSGMEA